MCSGQVLSGYFFGTNLEKKVPEVLKRTMKNHSLRISLHIVTMSSGFQRADSVYAFVPVKALRGPISLSKVHQLDKKLYLFMGHHDYRELASI